MINALVFQPEGMPLKQFESCLHRHCPDVKFHGTITDLKKVSICSKESKALLLFIDCTSPAMSLQQIISLLPVEDMEFIFLSEWKNLAYDAFQLGAAGFILKPVESEELVAAVKRAVWKMLNKEASDPVDAIALENISYQLSRDNLIGIPTMEGFDFIRIRDIIRCEGLQRCTQIVTIKQKAIISSYNLGEFRRQLEPYGFFSPHRSHLINLSYIKKYIKEGSIVLQNNTVVPVARRKKNNFLDLIFHI